jgi:hypothetical protein
MTLVSLFFPPEQYELESPTDFLNIPQEWYSN